MIKTEESHLNIAAGSHPGMAGKENEDRYGISAFLTGPKENLPAVLAVLCDGIGGHRAGEVAAAMGVEIITRVVTASDGRNPLVTLEEAITQASREVYEASQTDQGCKGMGATCACAWIIEDALFTANMGDSRIYLLRDGHFVQLTTDHTWIQEALDAGIITDVDRDHHPNAHVILRYLGSAKVPKPDFRLWFFEGEDEIDALENQGLNLQAGDLLLLCSDGLTDIVSDEEICSVLMDYPLTQASNTLIEITNRRGGHDNTTVVLLEVPDQGQGMIGKTEKPPRLIGFLAALVMLGAFLVVAFFGLRWWGSIQPATSTASPAIIETLPGVVFTPLPVTASPTEFPTPTTDDLDTDVTARPTLTPWPTHTQAP